VAQLSSLGRLQIMTDKLSHSDEYKLLREEVMQIIREIYRTEFWTGIAIGGLYSWLIEHKAEVKSPEVWFLGPVIVLIYGVRCLGLLGHMNRIGSYLKEIEKHSFGDDKSLPGWHWFFDKIGGNRRNIITAISIWSLMLFLTIFGSWILSRPNKSPEPTPITLSVPFSRLTSLAAWLSFLS
jgi:hypothetical protein